MEEMSWRERVQAIRNTLRRTHKTTGKPIKGAVYDHLQLDVYADHGYVTSYDAEGRRIEFQASSIEDLKSTLTKLVDYAVAKVTNAEEPSIG